MRFLNTKTLRLEEFFFDFPQYAILSHTWESEEINFQDMISNSRFTRAKRGFRKVQELCNQAFKDGYQYAWIDTCCINKAAGATGSEELSEALNSMFRWYQLAHICYAYLADVPYAEYTNHTNLDHEATNRFTRSRWFTRGWTLQELLAPSKVVFYSMDWKEIGTKSSLCGLLSEATGIGPEYLRGRDIRSASVARRMSWAANRMTTRVEDFAYCLLGIFDISMTMLYGEGKKAFVRLQEEILKNSFDQTLFSWAPHNDSESLSLFAQAPVDYIDCEDIIPDEIDSSGQPYALTNKGLRIDIKLLRDPHSKDERIHAILACRPEKSLLKVMGIPLRKLETDVYTRLRSAPLEIPRDVAHTIAYESIYIMKNFIPRPALASASPQGFFIRRLPPLTYGYRIQTVHTTCLWDEQNRLIKIPAAEQPSNLLSAIVVLRNGDRKAILIALNLDPLNIRIMTAWEKDNAPPLVEKGSDIREESLVDWREGLQASIGAKIELASGELVYLVDIVYADASITSETHAMLSRALEYPLSHDHDDLDV